MQQHQQKVSPSVHRSVGGSGHHVDGNHGLHSNENIRLQHEVGYMFSCLTKYFICLF